jgi:hypothetical protein
MPRSSSNEDRRFPEALSTSCKQLRLEQRLEHLRRSRPFCSPNATVLTLSGTQPGICRHVGSWPILLQKSFWGGERNFLEPVMRFTCGGVRDYIASSKIDHGSPQLRRKATQQERSPKVSFREIFRVVRFSTFATLSAHLRHAVGRRECRLFGVDRK